jgi:hypothetical protein
MAEPGQGTEFLLEFQQVGTYVKVTAVDPVTGTEASITGPASAGQAILGRNAVNKLKYVLRKKAGQRAVPRKGIEV